MTEQNLSNYQDENPEARLSQAELDKILTKRNLALPLSMGEITQKPKENLVLALRQSRKNSRNLMYGNNNLTIDYPSIKCQIETIGDRNQSIERQVKFELMGIDKSPIRKLVYNLGRFVNDYRGKDEEPAESLIKKQTNAIDSVIKDLNILSKRIDGRIKNLEGYYDSVLFELSKKAGYREQINNDMKGDLNLLEQIDGAMQVEDPIRKINYLRARRKLAKEVSGKFFEAKLNDRALQSLIDEYPVLQNLSDICEAHSNALKETAQEAEYMLAHTQNVTQMYLEIMRSQKYDLRLDNEVKKLFVYTDRMNHALTRYGSRMVEKANENSLFKDHYQTRAITLEGVLDNIENTNTGAYAELENRIAGYLGR